MLRRLAAGITMAVTMAGAVVVGGVIGAPAAQAGVKCWGDYCSGMDPAATGCAANAQTVAAVQLDDGYLDLRWSPTCQTNWARYEQYPFGSFASETPIGMSAVQDTGYSQSINWFEGDGGKPIEVGTYWTPMIYSPVHKVHAQLNMPCGSPTLIGTAFDCATNGLVNTAAV